MQQQIISSNDHFNQTNHGSFFLLGLMGSGKNYWADYLSNHFNIPAFHLDDEIEKSEQKTIADIFKDSGEAYFRNKESEILKTFSNKQSFILSVGGGTPCFNNNMDWMNANGITIWLDESVQTIKQRLIKEKTHRPLIADVANEDLLSFLSEMRSKRSKFYIKAKHHLKGDAINETSFLKIFSLYE